MYAIKLPGQIPKFHRINSDTIVLSFNGPLLMACKEPMRQTVLARTPIVMIDGDGASFRPLSPALEQLIYMHIQI